MEQFFLGKEWMEKIMPGKNVLRTSTTTAGRGWSTNGHG